LDFIGMLPLDLLVFYYKRTGTTIAFLRIMKLLHTRDLYSQLRHHYGDRGSSASRLIADIQFLYCCSLAVIHILACVWYDITTELPVYGHIDHTNFTGGITVTDVSPLIVHMINRLHQY